MNSISLETFTLMLGTLVFGCANAVGDGLPQDGQSQGGTGGQSVRSSSGGKSSSSETTATGTHVATGGKVSTGGTTATGGTSSSTSSVATGGKVSTGGTSSSTSSVATGGKVSTGGTTAIGGTSSSTSSVATGGRVSTGGTTAIGAGGTTAIGAGGRTTGTTATGGTSATTTTNAAGSGATTLDCSNIPAMPTSGAVDHSGTWGQGGQGNLAWQVWTNGGPGHVITYNNVAAFTASWDNSGDYLGRMGFEWGNAGKAYTSYGTIKADYAFTKSGTAGQYSYVGIYGWSTNPCIEWYIVEDSFHTMPFNTGTAPSGTAEIDGGTYNLVHRTTSGTGGDRCGGAGSWNQFYSIRTKGKQCGTITVSDHFKAWAAKGWTLGNLLEVKIVVEAAGGTGKVEFPIANVTTSQ